MDHIPTELKTKIALDLSFHDTLQFCQSNRDIAELCQDDRFWQEKAMYKYGKRLVQPSYSQLYRDLERASLQLIPAPSQKQLGVLNFVYTYYSMAHLDWLVNSISEDLQQDPNKFRIITDSTDPHEILTTIRRVLDEPLIKGSTLILESSNKSYIYGFDAKTPYPITQKWVIYSNIPEDDIPEDDTVEDVYYFTPRHIIEQLNKLIGYQDGYIKFVGFESGIPILRFVSS